MKFLQSILLASLVLFSLSISAQVNQVDLTQTPGAFTTTSVDLPAGQYQFNISNEDVGKDVGFVLVPKGKYDQENHIKEAYVQEVVADGKSSLTKVVTLEAGEYEYFCPLNPTPKYALTVHDDVETISLGQVEGAFTVQSLKVGEGKYQFDIANNGIDREVGFVLVPKGKYDAAHHIKAAYVKAPVVNGTSSQTGIVNLEAGEYEYFCPLNPTPKYQLTVVK